ncbi:MAG: redox-sensing transcriptional repressor Rex [Candidatus Cloacimonadota bacterium]|nr:redox-sensing transcriptional repressor Rex [Candidatus Cloacimonadota bacterium]
MKKGKISDLAIRRLPEYLQYLRKLQRIHVKYVSAPEIERQFGIHQTQIRKDLALTGLKGKVKVGHVVDDAIDAILHFLGWDVKLSAFIVGAGNLGSSLAGYSDLNYSGINIISLFDDNPNVIGRNIQGLPVFDVNELDYYAKKFNPKIGILTTPQEVAQDCADKLIKANIKAIWNFTTIQLAVPEDVVILTTCLCSDLAVITHRMKDLSDLKVKNQDIQNANQKI